MIREPINQDVVVKVSRLHAVGRHTVLGAAAVAGLLLVLGLGCAWSRSAHTVNAARLRIASVTKGTLVRDANVTGRVVAAVSPTLYATAQANVTLKAHAGDAVKKGDVLAVLESADLLDQLKREQASYEQLEAEVARQRILAEKQKLAAKHDADQAEIDRVAALRTFQLWEKAGDLGVIKKVEYDKVKDAVKSTEIRSKHAAQAAALENQDVNFELKTKQSQLQRQRAALDYAQRRVEDLTVRAPIDGVIGTISVADRAVVPANTPLMTLVDLSQLEVELSIPEAFANDIGLGMDVEIAAGDTKVKGKISAISPEVVKNEVLVRARFAKAQPEGLRQSQRVAARLLIEEKPNVLMLARGSFVENEGGKFAYVVENGIAQRRPITMGATSVASVEIQSGLKEGDKVVISGTDAFESAPSVNLSNLNQ